MIKGFFDLKTSRNIQFFRSWIIEYLRDTQELTNTKHQEINNIGKSISAVELQELIDKGVVNKIGKGKLTKYSLK